MVVLGPKERASKMNEIDVGQLNASILVRIIEITNADRIENILWMI